jgi:2-polyprenyl-3-methyl-5-hydroxy-6-metoxy-1,4-benzoquinol methylase
VSTDNSIEQLYQEVEMREKMEEISCNICGSMRTSQYLKMDGYSYKKCQDCGLVYQNPRPVFKDLKKRYGDNYFDYELSNQDNFFQLMVLGLGDTRISDFYGDDVKNRKFLDIGCATGLLLNYMKGRGWETKGVEICRSSAEYGIKTFGLDIFNGTLEDAAFPDNYFDVIHFSHLIEHVPDPKSLLVEIYRILKKDGHMLMTTPNADGWQARAAKSKWRSAIPDHIYLFTKTTMRKLLGVTNYRIVKQLSWGGIPRGNKPDYIKKPADKLAKFLNIGDVMLFHCTPG